MRIKIEHPGHIVLASETPVDQTLLAMWQGQQPRIARSTIEVNGSRDGVVELRIEFTGRQSIEQTSVAPSKRCTCGHKKKRHHHRVGCCVSGCRCPSYAAARGES